MSGGAAAGSVLASGLGSVLVTVFRRLRFTGALALASTSAFRAFSAFTSANKLEATPAREARSAISPSFVLGTYAPPANLKPQLLQNQMPTDMRLTAVRWHWGHSCGVLRPVMTAEYRFRTTVPYLAPKLPEGPTLYVLTILLHV